MKCIHTFRRLSTILAGVLCATLITGPHLSAATDTDPWVFVSSPDWFNTDVADLSGNTPGIPPAPGWDQGVSGGVNGISPQMEEVYSQLVGEMAAYGPDAFLVAGDLINGLWFGPAMLDMFAPESRDRGQAIDTATAIYYGWYRKLFQDHGIPLVIAAPGDHELGDDPWPTSHQNSLYVETMKRAFVRELIDVLEPPEPFPGIPAKPPPTDGYFASFAYRLRNVLFVSVDEFDPLAPGEPAHPWTGTLRLRVDGAHLEWLAELLTAADADPTIDHVIVQGHAPVIDPVRMQISSGLMLRGRQDSPLW